MFQTSKRMKTLPYRLSVSYDYANKHIDFITYLTATKDYVIFCRSPAWTKLDFAMCCML